MGFLPSRELLFITEMSVLMRDVQASGRTWWRPWLTLLEVRTGAWMRKVATIGQSVSPAAVAVSLHLWLCLLLMVSHSCK